MNTLREMDGGVSIVFIGGRAHGFQLLDRMLAGGERIVRVFGLQEDGHEPIRFDARIAARCSDAGVRHSVVRRLSKADAAELLELKPDLIVVMGWRTILPPEVVNAPRLGCVGVHDSLLPRYRGFAPTNWSIINGETQTGITLWYLNEEVDAGDVIAQQVIPIGRSDTAADVYAKVADASITLMLEHLPALKAGRVRSEPQDDALATFACARTPDDGLIDWGASSSQVYNLVRALTRPYPGAFTYHEGRVLRVWSATPADPELRYAGRIPGRVVKLHAGRGVEVLCGAGSVIIEEVELEGRAPCRAEELIRSVRATLGPSYQGLHRRIAALEKELLALRALIGVATLAGTGV